ncbi:ImmA/IrrE family metallo-endopeptidase [Lacticaseibacillus paracasei]|uniref:ImmA/IrrE family metallo-endopeptidase n=1 Tax=Lacticaseibacillus paracasei TaxID=1597 RepID=UPI0011843F3D|nr:ImmA/IrrE family metallo-endopeptidase [Lacticaseibacillus paracasei]DAZ12200.1 MAG TPA: IrrE protein [Caudoviricetes sp.]
MGYEADCAIKKADAVLRRYSTRDPWVLGRCLPNVMVIPNDLGENILGYTITDRKISIININVQTDEVTSDSVLAHEIGHALLTRNTGANYFYRNAHIAAVGSAEYIANCFMFEFLFGNQGPINPMNYNHILSMYGLPAWMTRYFDLIGQETLD